MPDIVGMSQILLGCLIGFQNVAAQKWSRLRNQGQRAQPLPCAYFHSMAQTLLLHSEGVTNLVHSNDSNFKCVTIGF